MLVDFVLSHSGCAALQVPMLRERLLQGKDWPAVAKQQKKAQFGAAAKQLAQERLKGMLESFEMMCQIEQQQQQQQGKVHAAGNADSSKGCSLLDGGGADEAAVLAAPIRVVCSRQVSSSLKGIGIHRCIWCSTCMTAIFTSGKATTCRHVEEMIAHV
jgi:hypothetical protein